MKLNHQQMNRIIHMVFEKWKKNNIVTFKEDEPKVFARALKAITDDLQKELDLEKEVNQMMQDLERSNPGQFQRYKMYPILKQKLAKEKKVIL